MFDLDERETSFRKEKDVFLGTPFSNYYIRS